MDIQNLKKAAKVLVSFGMQIEEVSEGGFKPAEFFKFIDEVAAIPEIIENKQLIIDEFRDLDSAEKTELSDYIKSELDLKNDRTEIIIEDGLDVLVAILKLVQDIRDGKPVAPAITPGL